MFGARGLGVWARPSRLAGGADESCPTIRILHRVDHHDGAAENRLDLGTAPRRQVIREREAGVAARRLVAVNRALNPYDRGQAPDELLGLPPRPGPGGR